MFDPSSVFRILEFYSCVFSRDLFRAFFLFQKGQEDP